MNERGGGGGGGGGQGDRICLGAEEADIYQSFSGLPDYFKNFYLSW